MEKLLQKLLSLPSNVALAIATLDLVEHTWLYPRYQHLVDKHQPHLPQLSPEDEKIVAGLEQHGIYITSLEALGIPQTAEFFAAAHQVSSELDAMTTTPAYFDKHTLTATTAQLLQHPEIFLWGASERLQQIAERYLRLPVAYDGLSFYFSVANGKTAGPRKWHRDKEDWRMVKVCVYLNHVNETGGPFECVFPEVNGQLLKLIKPKYSVLSHQDLQALLNPPTDDWFISCPGIAGTVIFVDTAFYYHRGKPPTTANRSAIFFSYFSDRPKHPFFCGRSPLSRQQLADLAQLLPAHLRAAITWKDRLPGIGRLIPKNRLKV